MDGELAIIGTGRLGEALLTGLLRSGEARPDQVVCTVRRTERGEQLARVHGVRTTTANAQAVADADVVVLGVKPQTLPGLLDELGGSFRAGQTVVSLAAGVRTDTIESRLAEPVAVVRVMTNTPVQVDQAMSVLAPGAHAGERELGIAERLLDPVGEVLRVDESQIDAVTAISGSGPAYVYLLAEAMIDAGVSLGLTRELATRLSVQTVLGAATMLDETGEHPVALREMVTSPGGTTIAALGELESHGLRSAVLEAARVAARRSRELAGDT